MNVVVAKQKRTERDKTFTEDDDIRKKLKSVGILAF